MDDTLRDIPMPGCEGYALDITTGDVVHKATGKRCNRHYNVDRATGRQSRTWRFRMNGHNKYWYITTLLYGTLRFDEATRVCERLDLPVRDMNAPHRGRPRKVAERRKPQPAKARGLSTQRRCHDCGKPTTDYRCPECWLKLRGVNAASDYAAHEGF